MVKKYVYGRPFETYAVVNAENVSDAAESEKREFFREADMKKALEPYGGITWDEPEDGNDAPAMQYRVRMSDGDLGSGYGESAFIQRDVGCQPGMSAFVLLCEIGRASCRERV